MRRTAAGLMAGLLTLALVGAAGATPAAAAAPVIKIALVVGATHSVTPSYRAAMDVVAATAAKYTTKVVKVYSPNATWAAVKSALSGASIVVYMGHGNGFPSPYSSVLRPTTQDGFGLNAAAGKGDSNNTYYGESYVGSSIQLAPGAVVILSHLCYASGNSEPGQPQPSLATAKQRIDNFAAGFMKAGASAVIADGHNNPSYYIDALFTTHQTIASLWTADPWAAHHAFSFASTRTPGRTAMADPDTISGGTYTNFYRSLVTTPGLTTDFVTGAPFASTDVDPTAFRAPGAADVTAVAGAPEFGDATLTGDAVRTLAASTRLRVLEIGAPSADGSPVLHVTTLDGTSDGYVAGSGLTPRDSEGPRIWMVDTGTGFLSPNGDGSGDTIPITATASESVSWHVRITAAGGAVVADLTPAAGRQLSSSWNGRHGSTPVADGTYTVTLSADDAWGNPTGTSSATVRVDTVAPTLSGGLGSAVPTFSPNGDGVNETVAATFATTEAGSLDVAVRISGGTTVRHDVVAAPAGSSKVAWDGRTATGAYAPDGAYALVVTPIDLAGNRGAAIAGQVQVYTALSKVAAAQSRFYPQDGDRIAATDRLSFVLDTAATATWTIVDARGNVVATRYAAAPLAPGTYAWAWNGRTAGGAMAPRGWYTSTVAVTDGTLATTERVRVLADAFAIAVSDTTPARGQSITISITSTEKLSRNPIVTIRQPGVKAHGVTAIRTGTYTYRVTYRLLRAGRAGTLSLGVRGYDTSRGYNTSTATYRIH